MIQRTLPVAVLAVLPTVVSAETEAELDEPAPLVSLLHGGGEAGEHQLESAKISVARGTPSGHIASFLGTEATR